MRELGRRSEAAPHPFRRDAQTNASEMDQTGIVAPDASRPLALTVMVGRRQEIFAACPVAQALGVTAGLATTHARVLAPDLDVRPAEPEADAAVLDRLALHAVRCWTPVVAACPPDGLWLDLTGSTHLFGGEERFCRRVVGFLRRAGFTAGMAVADTAGAAHALARHACSRIAIVPPGATLDALMPLPVASLRLAPAALQAARRFGFDTVGDLVPIARGPLARRLGLAAVERLDQALGRMAEPIVTIADDHAPEAERRLLEPIGTADQIRQVIADLLVDLVAELQARGRGARALRLVCDRVDRAEQVVAVGTSRPNRDAAHLLRLLSLRIERIEPGLGLERLHLTAIRTEPLGAVAFGALLAGDADRSDLPRLVDTLVGRAGPQALFRMSPVESHVPERAVLRADPLTTPGAWPGWRRPTRLLARPEPLSRVMALLPDQPPRRFEWRGAVHTIVAADGPERIHGEWWRREGEVWAVRDYFRLEDEHGARFWVFRRGDGVDGATGDLSWWLHGLFG